MSKETLDMNDIIIKALQYYSRQSANLTNELKKPREDQKRFDDELLRLFENDFDLIPDKIEHVINDMKDRLSHEGRWDELPSFIKKHETIITNSLSLYRRDLEEMSKIPKSKGFGEVELPNIKDAVKLIDKTINANSLKLS